ncbi:hypothetical protein [Hyphomonas sp.]|uniref:hypothetical protein n=1 Tax=Hyphomonas sp. TaxID=87 RepID=UPI0035653F81
MILRSLTEHVKDQNWFAVGLDFSIVVIGVLLAMQISNWNAAKGDRERGADYSAQLTAVLLAEMATVDAITDYYATTFSAGNTAYEGLSARSDIPHETILINAYRASQYIFYERRRSTYDEIINSGALNLIADRELRETATLVFATELFDTVMAEGQSRYRELFRMIVEPDLQFQLGEQCGDRIVASAYVPGGANSLDYLCELNADPESITAAVMALRADEDLIRALRLRNVQLGGRLSDLDGTKDALGLTSLFDGEAAR